MEPQVHDFTSTVDTSRPFTSVKEAVAIFGERLLVGEIYSPSPKPFSDTTTAYSPSPIRREPSWRFSSTPSPIKLSKEEGNNNSTITLLDTVKKLETELEKTKVELKMLKERGSETEVALATLNAELHKNMSKLAQAEAVAAGKAAVATKTVRFEIEKSENREGEKKMDDDKYMRRTVDSKKLGQLISLGENDHIFGGKNVRKKQKPIIPLVGDLLFFKRKTTSSTNHHNPLYASPL